MGRSSMHLSLVPRHDVGENIFLPKQCVPFCEFFQSVFAVRMCTRLSYWIKERGTEESRAFLPCLLGFRRSQPGSGTFSEIIALWCPVPHVWPLPPSLPHPLLCTPLSPALVSALPGLLTEASP